MRRADLHIHTEASDDSILTPEQILQQAHDAGLHAVAFTDHDGVGNIEAGRTRIAELWSASDHP